jgi:hypothetical protein
LHIRESFFVPGIPLTISRVVVGVSIGKNDLPDVSIVENIGFALHFLAMCTETEGFSERYSWHCRRE